MYEEQIPLNSQNELYRIIFCGEVQPNHDLLSVKSRIANQLGIGAKQVESLFLRKPVLLKTNMILNDARIFKMEFEKTGARCHLISVSQKFQPPSFETPSYSQSQPIPEEPPVNKVSSSSQPLPQIYSEPISQPIAQPDNSPTSQQLNSSFSSINTPNKRNQKKTSPFLIIFIILCILLVIGVLRDRAKKKSLASSVTTTPSTQTPTSYTRKTLPPISRKAPVIPANQEKLVYDTLDFYSDSLNYYSISLPNGFKKKETITNKRIKTTFDYGYYANITIIISPFEKKVDIQQIMEEKMQGISNGYAGFQYKNVNPQRYGLVTVDNIEGYEIVLKTDNRFAHIYGLFPGSYAISVAIESIGPNCQDNVDELDSAFKSNFDFY